MKAVLMRCKTDCEVAMLANACGVTYEQAKKAVGWRELPFSLENPIFANPINIAKALIKLGFWKDELTLTELLAGKAAPMRTCLLVKKSITQQHWINWCGLDEHRNHLVLWGNSEEYETVSPEKMVAYITEGKTFLTPNCAFQVYKANIFTLIWNKIRMLWS